MNDHKKRRAWLAFLLSLTVPGLGQLYNGQWRKAIIVYGINVGLLVSLRFMLVNFWG